METKNFEHELSSAFDKWSSGQPAEGSTNDFNKAIKFAFDNNIDLILKMPKSVYEKEGTKPISKDQADGHAVASDETTYSFEIPSQNTIYDKIHKMRFTLEAVDDFRGFGKILFLKNKA